MLDTIEYKNCVIEVHQDYDALNPMTEYHHLGRMICWHKRYQLGHDHDFSNEDDFFDQLKEEGPLIKLPLYLHDHSSITIKTTSFSYPWDSGKVGWIYCTKQQARNCLGVKRLNEKHLGTIKEILIAEVNLYDQYLKGEVYGYVTKRKNYFGQEGAEIINSCWGFFEQDYMIDQAKEEIDDSVPH